MKDILDLELPRNDAGAKTVRDYLKKLLLQVWIEDEGFSGKRPFGNSGWKYEIYAAMVKGGVVAGKFDTDGYLDDVEDAAADELIQDAIRRLR
jgi:hypothetical protein